LDEWNVIMIYVVISGKVISFVSWFVQVSQICANTLGTDCIIFLLWLSMAFTTLKVRGIETLFCVGYIVWEI